VFQLHKFTVMNAQELQNLTFLSVFLRQVY